MEMEVRLAWTANDWRRFLGIADSTLLVELMSDWMDQLAMAVVERRLAMLGPEHGAARAALEPGGRPAEAALPERP